MWNKIDQTLLAKKEINKLKLWGGYKFVVKGNKLLFTLPIFTNSPFWNSTDLISEQKLIPTPRVWQLKSKQEKLYKPQSHVNYEV